MIIAKYTVACNACGDDTGSSSPTAEDAQDYAVAGDWTTNTVTDAVGALHWCPPCTQARQEA